MNNTWRRLAGVIIFIGFIYLVERYFGWRRLLAPWANLPLWEIVLAATLAFLSYWLRAVRLYDYFRAEMRGGFAACFKLTLQHNLLNNLLPMRAGELSFPVLMARYFSIPTVRSLPVLFWFRFLDLHTLGIFALAAAWEFGWPRWVGLMGLALWLPLPFIAYRLSHRLHDHLANGAAGGIRRWVIKLLHSLPRQAHDFWRAWLWTVINWVVKVQAFAWVLSLFIAVSFGPAWMGVIGGDLTSVLPVHGVAGMGTYEAGVVAGLLPYGVELTAAVPAAVNLHLFVLGTTLIGGALSLMIRRREAHG